MPSSTHGVKRGFAGASPKTPGGLDSLRRVIVPFVVPFVAPFASRFLAPPTAWMEELGRARSNLSELGAATEGAFLEAGGRLVAIAGRTREVSDHSLRVSELVSGELSATAANLSNLLDELRRYAVGAEENEALLAGTDRAAHELAAELAGFEAIVRMFRVLGTLTRVESARLESISSEFQTLSESAQRLGRDIEDRTESMLRASSDLIEHADASVRRASGMASMQAGEIGAIAERIRAGLSEFDTRRATAGELSSSLVKRYAEVSRRTGEVVASLQTHDITRQRLEHAADAMGDLRARLASEGRKAAGQLVRGAALERKQVESARAGFLDAIGVIDGNLEAVGAEVAAISEYSRRLLESSDSSGKDFFAGVEEAFGGLGAAIAVCSEEGLVLLESTRAVKERCGAMSRFIADMEAIGDGMQLIAVNTSIQTARLGAAGAALGALADSLQAIALQAAGRCRSAGEKVQVLVQRSRELEAAAAGQCAFQTAAGTLIRKAEDVVQSLRTTHEESVRELDAILGGNRDVGEQIRLSLAAMGVREQFAATTQEVADVLGRVGAEALRRYRGCAEATELPDMAQRYTMHSERIVHQSHIERAVVDEKIIDLPTCAQDEALGANVELF